jgi:hypothetical protein
VLYYIALREVCSHCEEGHFLGSVIVNRKSVDEAVLEALAVAGRALPGWRGVHEVGVIVGEVPVGARIPGDWLGRLLSLAELASLTPEGSPSPLTPRPSSAVH